LLGILKVDQIDPIHQNYYQQPNDESSQMAKVTLVPEEIKRHRVRGNIETLFRILYRVE